MKSYYFTKLNKKRFGFSFWPLVMWIFFKKDDIYLHIILLLVILRKPWALLATQILYLNTQLCKFDSGRETWILGYRGGMLPAISMPYFHRMDNYIRPYYSMIYSQNKQQFLQIFCPEYLFFHVLHQYHHKLYWVDMLEDGYIELLQYTMNPGIPSTLNFSSVFWNKTIG